MKQQRANAELETIIDEFGRAMRDANRNFIANYIPACEHEQQLPFTPHMERVWEQYIDWCSHNE